MPARDRTALIAPELAHEFFAAQDVEFIRHVHSPVGGDNQSFRRMSAASCVQLAQPSSPVSKLPSTDSAWRGTSTRKSPSAVWFARYSVCSPRKIRFLMRTGRQ